MLQALRSASCNIIHETRDTICYVHWVLRFVVSHRRQGVRLVTGIGVRFVTGIGFCVLGYTRQGVETGGTICDGHWVLRLVISHTRQMVRFVTGIGFCVLRYLTRDKGYDLLRALGCVSCDIT